MWSITKFFSFLAPELVWRYLMPRCTRTERQCASPFVPGSPTFCTLTNQSVCAYLQQANWQQCYVQVILGSCWAINWFWCKPKWKWGHSHMHPTEANWLGISCCTLMQMQHPRWTEMIFFTAKDLVTSHSWEGQRIKLVRVWRGGLLLCLGGGLRPAARTRLETVMDGSQACTQEGGKEKGGGRVSLGKSVGGGGRERGKRNCEIFQLVFFKIILCYTKILLPLF